MNQPLKTELLRKAPSRCSRRDRVGKMRLLDDLCEDHGYERKYASRLLRAATPVPSGRLHPGPEPRYALIEPVVRAIWVDAENPAANAWPRPAAVAAALPETVGKLSRRACELVRSISPATRTACWPQRAPPSRCGVAAAPSPARCSRPRSHPH